MTGRGSLAQLTAQRAQRSTACTACTAAPHVAHDAVPKLVPKLLGQRLQQQDEGLRAAVLGHQLRVDGDAAPGLLRVVGLGRGGDGEEGRRGEGERREALH